MPKIIQVVCGSWEQSDQSDGTIRLQNILIGLAVDGTVWKFVGNGWRPLPMISVT